MALSFSRMLQHWRSSASSSSTLDKEELAHREQEAVIATEDNDILAMKEELSPTGKAASQENVVTSEEEEEEEENPCSTLTEKPKAKISSCNNHEGATGTGIGTGIEQSPSPADLGGRGLPSLNPFQRWGGGNRNWNPAVALSKGEEAGADVETVVTPSEAHQQQLGGLLQLVEHQSAEEKNKETPCERQTLEENSDQKIGKSTSESDQETTAATSVETTGSQQNSRLLFRPFQRWRAAPAPAEKEEESIAAIHNHPTPSDLDALQTEEDKAQSAKKNDEGNRGKATDSALGGDSCTSSREPCQKGAENVKEDSKEIASAAYANAYSASENDGKQTGGFSLNLFRRRRSGNNGDTSCVDRKTTGIEGESSEDAITNEKEDEEAATKQPLAKSETIQGLSEPPDNAITSSTLAEKMRKGAVAVVGGTLTTVGLVMIPLPTPMFVQYTCIFP